MIFYLMLILIKNELKIEKNNFYENFLFMIQKYQINL